MNPQHHPIFQQVNRSPAASDSEFDVNFVGAKVRRSFEEKLNERMYLSGRCALEDSADPSLPSLNGEDYLEWIDVLESISLATRTFTMIEAGAGYGRWLVNAAKAIRSWKAGGIETLRLVGLEPDAERFGYMHQHFKDNDLRPAEHLLIHSAVSDTDNGVFFRNLDNDPGRYGAAVMRSEAFEKRAEHLPDAQITDPQGQVIARKVPCMRLSRLIELFPVVDLIDFDVQGEEVRVIRESLTLLNQRVKRLHIGTHSTEIEDELRAILTENGWVCRGDYRIGTESPTPYGGVVRFTDGIQSWLNPRLA